MPDNPAIIINRSELLELQKAKRVSERQHWSFSQGADSYEVITLTDGSMLGVVTDPAQLGREAREEIAAVIESERSRRAEVNPQTRSAAVPTQTRPSPTPLNDAR